MSNVPYRLIDDPEYGYRRVDPLPSREEVERFYKEEFYSGAYKAFNDSDRQVQLDDWEFFEGQWDDKLRHGLRLLGRERGVSLFDVGCGFGLALAHYRSKGINVAGVDPAPEAVAYACSQGLDVRVGGIDVLAMDSTTRYDLVTLNNVLEHLREPARTLLSIRESLLTRDGVLVVDVPNEFNPFQTVADAQWELGQWWVCPPNHINYFTPATLQHLLERCGYEVLYSEGSFPMEMFLLMGEVYVGDGEVGRSCHRRRVHFESVLRKHGAQDVLSRFYAALAQVGLGRQVVMYARAKH